LAILNMTPVDRPEYRIGVEVPGTWTLIDHSDKPVYWGRDRAISEVVPVEEVPWDYKSLSMAFNLPGLTIAIYKWTPAEKPKSIKAKKVAVKKAVKKVVKKKVVKSKPKAISAAKKTTSRKK